MLDENINVNLRECASCFVWKNVNEFSSYQKGTVLKIFYICNECFDKKKKRNPKLLIYFITISIILLLAAIAGIIILTIMKH